MCFSVADVFATAELACPCAIVQLSSGMSWNFPVFYLPRIYRYFFEARLEIATNTGGVPKAFIDLEKCVNADFSWDIRWPIVNSVGVPPSLVCTSGPSDAVVSSRGFAGDLAVASIQLWEISLRPTTGHGPQVRPILAKRGTFWPYRLCPPLQRDRRLW